MFEIITIFVMFLEEVSYSHQDCILKKYSKNNNLLKSYKNVK